MLLKLLAAAVTLQGSGAVAAATSIASIAAATAATAVELQGSEAASHQLSNQLRM
jgi:hypothetical protein